MRLIPRLWLSLFFVIQTGMENEKKKKGKRRWAIEMPPADGDAARAWLLSTKKEKRGNLS